METTEKRTNIHQSMLDFAIESTDHTRGYALAYGNIKLSFVEFLKKVDECAGRLAAEGIKQGDCVCICLPNIPQAEIAFYACGKLGAVASMVHAKTSPAEFEKLLKLTKPKIAMLTEVNYFSFKPLLKNVKIVFCSLISGRGFIGLKKAVPYEPVKLNGDEPAVYMHSGGTTGASKTAVLSHRSLNALVDNLYVSMHYPYNETDTMLSVLPMFHGFGLAVGIHMALGSRMCCALMPLFDAKKAVAIMKKHHVTTAAVIPRILQKLLAEPSFKGEVVKQIRHLYVGGDNLDENLRLKFNEKLKAEGSECTLWQGYGLTEMGSVCILNYDDQIPNSIGQALIGVDAKVVDENLIEIPRGETGELILRSEQMMDGYLCDEKTTSEAFAEIKGEKWLKTGDLMKMNENGYLFFKGRKKRLIKISGMNVFPLEIEECAKKLPEIEHCVATQKNVNGKPFVCLYMVLAEGVSLDEKLKSKLTTYFEKNLSHWSVPKYFEAVTELPHTIFGKVDFKAVEHLCNEKKN